MKQRLKRFMAGFLAMLTVFTTLFTNGATAFAASPSANIAFWNASVKDSGEVSELKQGYKHGKILYAVIDGNAAYCMNFGLAADGGQLMNSYENSSTSMTAEQEKLLSYCLYYGYGTNSASRIFIGAVWRCSFENHADTLTYAGQYTSLFYICASELRKGKYYLLDVQGGWFKETAYYNTSKRDYRCFDSDSRYCDY